MNQQQNESAVDRELEAMTILNSGPDDLPLTEAHKEVVYLALLEVEQVICVTGFELEHEWRHDHWWTRFGAVRTLGGLRRLQNRIIKGGGN